MEKEILGVCPTCYLVVKEGDPYAAEISSDESIYYHRECEPRRMKFIKSNAKRWVEDGSHCKALRETWDFTIGELSEAIGVSESKLRKFESGKPVTHARLLSLAIIRFFQLYESQIKTSSH